MIRLYGYDLIKVPLYKSVQARKHKSKRINKKWFKRYGMKMIQIRPRSNQAYTIANNIMIPEEIWDSFIEKINYFITQK